MELRKVGVSIDSEWNFGSRCNHCGQYWIPRLCSGGEPARGYWICPNGCNR